jgi:hypothetical protein
MASKRVAMHHQPLTRRASLRSVVIVGLPPLDALIVYDGE